MNKKPLVSILTITHNRADLISRCIESIRNQTYRNYEHIIVDGASNDNTEEVVSSYHDEHIKYIKLAEKGPAIQMKVAFEASIGNLITFLDDDDEYLPEKIEKQVLFALAQPEDVGLTCCWMSYFDTNSTHGHLGGKPFRMHCPMASGDVSDVAISRPTICGTPTLMLKRSVINEVGGIYRDDIGLIGSDWEFASRVCQITKVACLPESLVNVYVNHGHTRLTTDQQNQRLDKIICFHEYFLSAYVDKFIANPKLAEYHIYNLCIAYIKKNEFKKGFKYYRQLLRLRPSLKNILVPLTCVLK